MIDTIDNDGRLLCAIENEFIKKEYPDLMILLTPRNAALEMDSKGFVIFKEKDILHFDFFKKDGGVSVRPNEFKISPNTFCSIAKSLNLFSNYFFIAVDKVLQEGFDLEVNFGYESFSDRIRFSLKLKKCCDNRFYFGDKYGLEFSVPITFLLNEQFETVGECLC